MHDSRKHAARPAERGRHLQDELRSRAAAMGLAERVLFLGERENPFNVMRACQCGLLTSEREGFPNVIPEMMACGLRKIVVTPCAGDLASRTGVFVAKTRDAVELASALAAAMQLDEDRSGAYAGALQSRSIDHYLDAVLGETLIAPSGRVPSL